MKSAPLKSGKKKEHSSRDDPSVDIVKKSKEEEIEELKMLEAAAKARASKYNFEDDDDDEEGSFVATEYSLEDQKKSLIKQKGG